MERVRRWSLAGAVERQLIGGLQAEADLWLPTLGGELGPRGLEIRRAFLLGGARHHRFTLGFNWCT